MRNFLFLFILFSAPALAQKTTVLPPKSETFAATDRLALQIPEAQSRTTQGLATFIQANFGSEEEKARAIFMWIATNIEYDVANMHKVDYYKNRQEVIDRTLATREGICQGYAEIFQEVCQKVGLEAHVVEGYTRQNGTVDYLPHAWNAARLNGTWYFFDPTWGAGFGYNGKFVRKVNPDFFKVKPEVLISSHIPFDPMWQFLPYPITHQEFAEGKTQTKKSQPIFHHLDSLAVYQKQDALDQLEATARRVEAHKSDNPLVANRLRSYHHEIDVIRKNGSADQFNAAVASFNQAVQLFNRYIDFRNRQFTPPKPDTELKGMLASASTHLNRATKQLGTVTYADKSMKSTITALQKNMEALRAQVKEQQGFLSRYLATSQTNRKTLFYK